MTARRLHASCVRCREHDARDRGRVQPNQRADNYTDIRVERLTGIRALQVGIVVHVIVDARTGLGSLEWIPDGEPGTWATLIRMRELVHQGARDPVVRETAERVIREAGVGRSSLAAIEALHRFVADRITYKRDPAGMEQLSTARRTLEKRNEDCDGKATLFAALVQSISHPATVGFRAISTSPLTPRHFVHVFNFVRMPGRPTLAADATYPGTRLGWQYGRIARLVEMPC